MTEQAKPLERTEAFTRFNLLTEPIFRVRLIDETENVFSLPDVFSLLVQNKVNDFRGVRPHQRSAWHQFLVQVGYFAVESLGDRKKLPDTSQEWRTLLRSLTPTFQDDEPWCLVVSDIYKPAFLQPPLPNKAADLFMGQDGELSPERRDLLISAANHAVKENVYFRIFPEHWVYSLVSLQTQSGFPGGGYRGIARMNGPYGSRPLVHLRSGQPGTWFSRDLAAARSSFEKLELELVPLLWLEPWNGEDSLSVSRFHPMTVEICRLLRLALAQDNKIVLRITPTRASRVSSKELNGVLQDPWAPIKLCGKVSDERAVFTVSEEGFSYRVILRLLDETQFERPVLASCTASDPENGLKFVCSALKRGQGKTEGLHSREIPISPRIRKFFTISHTDELAQVGHRRAEEAANAQDVLRASLNAFLSFKPSAKKRVDPRVKTWTAEFDRIVDTHFFEALFSELETEAVDEKRARQLEWMMLLKQSALCTLQRAQRSFLMPRIRRYEARARSERIFFGKWKKTFQPRFPELWTHELPLEEAHAD